MVSWVCPRAVAGIGWTRCGGLLAGASSSSISECVSWALLVLWINLADVYWLQAGLVEKKPATYEKA